MKTVDELLLEYESWASGEVSEISDEAMNAGREAISAIHETGCLCDECTYARKALREEMDL